MRKIIFVFILTVLSPFWIDEVNCNKNYEFHFIRMENLNETGELFKYDLKSVEKINETSFKVNCDMDLFTDLDDEWHMWIQAYHNEEGKEEFTEKPQLGMPKKALCGFMTSTYKTYFWPHLKDSSNLPAPEECPIKANHFWIKDYIFNGDKYKAMMKPGMWRVDMFLSQDHEDSHITKMGIRVLASVTEMS